METDVVSALELALCPDVAGLNVRLTAMEWMMAHPSFGWRDQKVNN